MIELTDKAIKEIKRIIAEQDGDAKLYLRVRVVGGGCSGFQTKLDLDTDKTAKDELFEIEDVNVIVDNRSLMYIADVSIDFHEDLNKRGFVVNNPSAKTVCGCGSSFSM